MISANRAALASEPGPADPSSTAGGGGGGGPGGGGGGGPPAAGAGLGAAAGVASPPCRYSYKSSPRLQHNNKPVLNCGIILLLHWCSAD